jgi:AraC-like DNA-binding protein
MGLSVIEHLTNIRLEAAKKIMDADPLVTIIDVADRVGYSDPYYFSKCFRKHFGLAPTAYLRKKSFPAPD